MEQHFSHNFNYANDDSARFEKLFSYLEPLKHQSGHVWLLPHARSDGDALGAAAALALAFQKLGINASVLLDEEPEKRLNFLIRNSNFSQVISIYDKAKARLKSIKEAQDTSPSAQNVSGPLTFAPDDLVFLVDCHEKKRTENRAALINSQKVICLDHHEIYAEKQDIFYGYICAGASSSCEIAADFLLYLQQQSKISLFDTEIASFLTAGIMTDTGRFAYKNTTPHALELAAYFRAQYNVDFTLLTDELFNSVDLAALRFRAFVTENIVLSHDQKIAMVVLHSDYCQKFGVSAEAFDYIVNMARNINTVKIAVVFKEDAADKTFRVSIRSDESFDAAAFAARYQGGGHKMAAGFKLGKADILQNHAGAATTCLSGAATRAELDQIIITRFMREISEVAGSGR